MLSPEILTVPDVVVWATAHSVWQGVLIWVGCCIGRRMSGDPAIRARIAHACLILFVVVQLGTVLQLTHAPVGSRGAYIVDDEAIRDIARNIDQRGRTLPIEMPRSLTYASAVDAVRPMLPWLAVAWAMIVLVIVARTIVALLILRREVGLAKDITQTLTIAHRLQLRKPVRILECNSVSVPATAGWLRPVVLLPPPNVLSLTRGETDALTLHELSHIARSDFLTSFLGTIVCALYPLSIGIHAVVRRASDDAEEAADADAAAAFGDQQAYARSLVALAERRLRQPLLLGASGGSLKQRVQKVLRLGSRPQHRRRRVSVSASLLVAAVSIGVAGIAVSQVAADGRDARWLASHNLAEAIVDTISADRVNPNLEIVLSDAIDQVVAGRDVDGATADDIATAAASGISWRMLEADALKCESTSVIAARLGKYGQWRDRRRVVAHLIARANAAVGDPERARFARAALALSCIDIVVDGGASAQKLVRDPDFFELLNLQPSQAYRLQLAWAIHDNRLKAAGPVIFEALAMDSPSGDRLDRASAAATHLPAFQILLTRASTKRPQPHSSNMP